MARTVKTSGLATNCTLLVAVDDDDSTIVEFINNRAITQQGTISTNTASWKGSTQPYWSQGNSSQLNFNGTRTSIDVDTGISVVAIMHRKDKNNSFNPSAFIGGDSTVEDWMLKHNDWASGAETALWRTSGNDRTVTNANLPVDNSTQFSFCGTWKSSTTTTGYQYWYATAAASTATDLGSGTTGTPASSWPIYAVGGVSGVNRSVLGAFFMVAVFNKQISQAEFESLHADPFGVMFAGASAPTVSGMSPSPAYGGQTSVVVSGTGFGASQGSGHVYISPTNSFADAAKVEQTIAGGGGWSDTSIGITVVRGSLPVNTNLYLFVQETGGTYNATGTVVQIILDPIRLKWTV